MQQVDHFGKQRTGLLCYIVGMVVILTVYRVLIAVVAQLKLFDNVADYQRHVQGLATFLLFLMLGLLWLAYRQWQSIIHERDQLETILESIGPDMIIAIDPNNRILRCGGAVQAMTGYTPEELIGQTADTLYHNRQSDGQGYEIQSAIQHAGFHLGYATGRTKDGNEYLLEIQTSGMHNRNGGAVLILHNLDERQHARVQLQRRVKLEETFADISATFLSADPELFGNACLDALEQTAKIFDHEFAGAGFFDALGHTLRNIWIWPQRPESSDPVFTEALTKAVDATETNGKIAYLFPEDLKDAPDALAGLHEKWNIRSIVLSPMQLHGRNVGFLTLFSKERGRRWASEDNSSLRALTSSFLTGELSMQAVKRLEEIPSHPPAAQPQPDEGASSNL
ncbi:MAG: PAS domain S-box protein [Kiritimatiellales bacterium]|nr:PAS domain S-box protein [Kiritimatiellota bacterium]MBL7011489.1 PAS domain S-box protein [Kiritimatiellales bacterium]